MDGSADSLTAWLTGWLAGCYHFIITVLAQFKLDRRGAMGSDICSLLVPRSSFRILGFSQSSTFSVPKASSFHMPSL